MRQVTADIPAWDARHQDITRLFDLTEVSLERMIFNKSDLENPLMHAAAYFARCRRLLIGMDLLLEQGMPDVSPVLLRPLFECWLRGRWLLYKGKEAYDVLRRVGDAKEEQWNTRQATVDWITKMGWVSEKDLGALTLVAQMADVVGGDALSSGSALVESYYMAYVSESEKNIHHGLAGIVEGTSRRVPPSRCTPCPSAMSRTILTTTLPGELCFC